MRVTRAKTRSTCTACNTLINTDDAIVQPIENTWTHIRCARTFLDPGQWVAGVTAISGGHVDDGSPLRGGTSDTPREARTDQLRGDVLHTTPDTASQEKRRDERGNHHTPWTEFESNHLRNLINQGVWVPGVGYRPISANKIGFIYGRTTAAIQSQIVKLHGADSPEVALYGTYNQPGPYTDTAPGDDSYTLTPYWKHMRKRQKERNAA